ncbi:hypothetical protein [Methylobacterium planeticum]|nr:hypothetical protein [Methylobacterium planeticum]
MSGPAAILTILIQPVVRQTADEWTAPLAISVPAAASAIAPAPLPGMRPVSLALSPTRVAAVSRPAERPAAVANQPTSDMNEKSPLKPRRMREGCEGALSSLVGPEARRMVPGRCIS